MTATVVVVAADEDDAAVAVGRSVGLPLHAYSVAVVAAVERLRRRRLPLSYNDVGKSDDDAED